ncbi:RES family NAD+ phosphorylase [Nitrincola iocasae]
MRCLKVKFSAELIDAVSINAIHVPNDYTTSRIFRAKVKKSGEAGLQYRSVRHAGATCWALMSPSPVESAVQTQHFEFVFDGESISKVRELKL